jgi:hypothetical protein
VAGCVLEAVVCVYVAGPLGGLVGVRAYVSDVVDRCVPLMVRASLDLTPLGVVSLMDPVRVCACLHRVSSLYYMKQTVGNACGTVALLHAAGNCPDLTFRESVRGRHVDVFMSVRVRMHVYVSALCVDHR